jgi:hypothetical protein
MYNLVLSCIDNAIINAVGNASNNTVNNSETNALGLWSQTLTYAETFDCGLKH